MAKQQSKPTPGDNLAPLADEYGYLKAQLATLEKRKKELATLFQQAGLRDLEGDLFRCVVSDIGDSMGPDWEKLARKLGASDRMIEHPNNQKVTKKGHTRITCSARTDRVLGK